MKRNELQAVEANFRASNYLSVAQLFLKFNVDVYKLKRTDLKERVFGHWGCCPGINYFYAEKWNRQGGIVPRFSNRFPGPPLEQGRRIRKDL